MGRNRKMPNKHEIHIHWQSKLVDFYGKFWIDELSTKTEFKDQECCFACGVRSLTVRCHIKPVCEGGSDFLDNLHLLCSFCHEESESFYGALYFEWFTSKGIMNSMMHKARLNKVELFLKLYNDGKIDLLPNYVKDLLKQI